MIQRTGPRIAVVVLNWNGLADTLVCLDSLARCSYRPLEIIVVDNGSEHDPTQPIQERHPGTLVQRLADNFGFAGGCNAGIRLALQRGAEAVLLLNNDTVVAEQLLERLVEALTSRPGFGVVGAVVNQLGCPNEVVTDGCRYRPGNGTVFERVAVDLQPPGAPAVEVDIVNGCCLLATRSVFETVGLLDERFFLIHEEADFCLRAQAAGFRLGIVPATLVWHRRHASFDRAGRHLQSYYNIRNLWLLFRKHPAGGGRGELMRAFICQSRYRYDLAVERDDQPGAKMVAAGLRDALTGRFGRRVERWDGLDLVAVGALALARRAGQGRRALATAWRALA